MSPVESIRICFRKYAQFRGRAQRSEFWWWVLFVSSVELSLVLALWAADSHSSPLVVVLGALLLFLVIPSWAVTVRRLHDTGSSRWTYFVVLIPLVGAIAFIVYLATEGDPGLNRYGDPPNLAAVQMRSSNDIRTLADSKESGARVAAARNRGAPKLTLERLANDSDVRVRTAVANNDSTSTVVLQQLAIVDPAPSVVIAAKANLERRSPPETAGSSDGSDDVRVLIPPIANGAEAIVNLLERIGVLRTEGQLTEEEFQSLKRLLIGTK